MTNKKTMTIDYENFKQVTTAGHVIETIRADILWHQGEQAKRIMDQLTRYAKIRALQGVLNTLTLQELKMEAWQEMKGSEQITGELYKQLANGELFKQDHEVELVKNAEAYDKFWERDEEAGQPT